MATRPRVHTGPRAARRGPFVETAFGLMLAALVFCLCRSANGQQTVLSEYEIKAAMLYNFAKFVEWPAGESRSSDVPLTVGVLGRDPFGAALDGIVREQNGVQRGVSVRRFSDLARLEFCHILFVSISEKERLPQILAAASQRNMLTVSDMDGFARAGGAIGFVLGDNRIGFEINPDAGRRASLAISSKLLRLARVVLPERGG
jgi:hypothetical protein